MSTEIFNDSRHPFDDTSDERSYYLNSSTQAAYDCLLSDLYGHKGVVLLVGESGTGKTALLHRLEQVLTAARHSVVWPRCPGISFDELLETCCRELQVPESGNDRMARVRDLAASLLERMEVGTTAVILVDDAQVLSDGTLEDLCWLTDLEIDGQKLIQVVLAGQPDLVPRLCGSKLPFLQESAITYCGLEPLDPGEVGSYIRQRLQAVEGWDPDLFSSEAIERVAKYAQGVPRVVNQICAAALEVANRESGGAVSVETVEAAVRELVARSYAVAATATPSEIRSAPPDSGPRSATPIERATGIPTEDHARSTAASNAATHEEPPAPSGTPTVPAPDDGMQGRQEAAASAAGGTALKIAEEAPPEEETENGTALAPFPRGLVVPLADTRPARQRALFAPVAALLLAGVVLGGLGILVQEFWFRSSNDILPRAQLSVTSDKQPEASDETTVLQVAPAPEMNSRAETTADQSDAILAPGAEPPAVSAPKVYAAHVSGGEDEAIPLDIRVELPAGTGTADLEIVVAGLPQGARLSTGREDADGSWALTSGELPGLTLTPPSDFDGPLRLAIDATARRTDGTSASARDFMVVEVEAEADRPRLTVAEAAGSEGQAVPLDIRAATADVDGSESLSVAISGLPAGTRLSAGRNSADDGWDLHPDELPGLELIPPAGFSGRFEALVTATAWEANGDASETAAPLKVEVARAPLAFAAAKGDFVIQLAALRSEADAQREAMRLKDRFPELLGNARLKVYEAEVNGVPYFRVRTQSVPDKAEVFQICARLKSSQQDCMVLQQIAAAKPIASQTEEVPAGPPPLSLLPREVTVALVEANKQVSAAEPRQAAIAVRDFVTARDIADREPIGVTTSFSSQDDRAVAYAKIDNPGAPTPVSFVWLYDDSLYATVDMEVGTSVRWRTWSSAQLSLGAWRVQLVSADGEVLAEKAFTVE